MPPHFLKSDLHIATVGDDLVCLDANAGEYGLLCGLGRSMPTPGAGGRLDDLASNVAASLLEAGLVQQEPSGDLRVDFPPPPAKSWWRAGGGEPSLADRLRFVRAYVNTTPRFWHAPFGGLIATARRGRPAAPSAGTPALWRDMQVFDLLEPLAPFQGECLYRAFLLLAYLRLEGRDASWVFGVRTYPFQAHCWLQVGDILLNDAVERVCAYTPIFAV